MDTILEKLTSRANDDPKYVSKARTRAVVVVGAILCIIAACAVGYVIFSVVDGKNDYQTPDGIEGQKISRPDLYICSGEKEPVMEDLKRAKRQKAAAPPTLLKRVPRPLSLPPPTHGLNYTYNPPLYHDIGARCAWGHISNKRVPGLEDVGLAYDFQQLEARPCDDPEECKSMCLRMHKTDDPYLCNYFTWHRQKKLALFYFLEPTQKWNLTEDSRVETFFWQCRETQCAWWWRPQRVFSHLSDFRAAQLRRAPGVITATQCADFATCQFSCESRPSIKELSQGQRLPEGAQPDDPSCSYVIMPAQGTQNRESFLFAMPQTELKNVTYRGSSLYDSFELICQGPETTPSPTTSSSTITTISVANPPKQPPAQQSQQASQSQPQDQSQSQSQSQSQPQPQQPESPVPDTETTSNSQQAQSTSTTQQAQSTTTAQQAESTPSTAQVQETSTSSTASSSTQSPSSTTSSQSSVPEQSVPDVASSNSTKKRQRREATAQEKVKLRECRSNGDLVDCSQLEMQEGDHPSQCIALNQDRITNGASATIQSNRPAWFVLQHEDGEQTVQLMPGLRHAIEVVPQSGEDPNVAKRCGPVHLRHRRCTTSCNDRLAVDNCGCTLSADPDPSSAAALFSLPVCDEERVRACVNPIMGQSTGAYTECMKGCKDECNARKPFSLTTKAISLPADSPKDQFQVDLAMSGELPSKATTIVTRPVSEPKNGHGSVIMWMPIMVITVVLVAAALCYCARAMM